MWGQPPLAVPVKAEPSAAEMHGSLSEDARLNLFERESQFLTLLDETNVVQVTLAVDTAPGGRSYRLSQNAPALVET
jgi:hypothetical protein